MTAEHDLGHLYRSHITMIRRRCRRIVGDEPMADDLAQDVFVTYAEKYGAGPSPERAGALLYAMATNRAINALRDGRRRRELLAAEGPAAEAGPAAPSDAGIDVRRVLAHVDPELAAIAVYYYVDGMDQDEIADVTALHRRTVSRRIEAFREAAQRLFAKPAVAL
ncbi:MAG: sigma-70 family RNA polymerase sigma factor [Myxococcota bacterium]